MPQRFVISDAKKSIDVIINSIAKKDRLRHSTYAAATHEQRKSFLPDFYANNTQRPLQCMQALRLNRKRAYICTAPVAIRLSYKRRFLHNILSDTSALFAHTPDPADAAR